ncbi:MAG TPA: hypothetical protein VIK29_03555 [Paludibacter sp.]
MKITTGILFTLLLMAFSCDKIADHVYSITVKNNTSHDIQATPGLGPNYMSSYPDTAIPELKPDLVPIAPNGYSYLDLSAKWETIFPRLPADTLSIYIFSTDTLNVYDWSKIRTGYKVLKRYDLSLDDLQKSNYTITYP